MTCCTCQQWCYIVMVMVFMGLAVGVYELIHHAVSPREPVGPGSVSKASDDVLEVDPSLNIAMSEASPITLILVIGGVICVIAASFLTHKHVVKPYRKRSTERQEEEAAHKDATVRALDRIQSRLEQVEEGEGRGNRDQRTQVEARHYPNGLSLQHLAHALEHLGPIIQEPPHHQQPPPRSLPAPPAPAPSGLHSQQSQGSHAERAYRLPTRGN